MLTLAALASAKFSFLAAVVASLVLTPLARAIARQLGVLDHPDGTRKLHGRSVPLWGGVAVYLAMVTGLLIARLGAVDSTAFDQLSTTMALACGLVCLVGAIDDSRDLNARVKLGLQIAAVLPVVMAGYSFDRIVAFGYPLDFGWLGVPLTILWLLGCINAVNLLDGLDGLASIVGISASLMMAIIATHTGHADVGVVALVLAGALIGFLAYNLPPAKIFLGDSGSMVIGLVVGMVSIQGALKTTATLSITVPAIVMSVPMLDTLFAIVRRKLSGRPFDAADRGHIHHRLLERGLTDWQALGLIGALCLTTGVAAIAATILRLDSVGWITALALIVVLIRTRAFGHHEVALARRFVSVVLQRLKAAWGRGLDRRDSPPQNQDPWHTLVSTANGAGASGFELLFADHESQARFSWRGERAPGVKAAAAPVEISLRPRDGLFCQWQLLGVAAEKHTEIRKTIVTDCLESLVYSWQSDRQLVPPSHLHIEYHRTDVRAWRPAA